MGKDCLFCLLENYFSVSHVLESIECDIWGPLPMISFSGNRYYVFYVDAFTRFSWVYFIKSSSNVFSFVLKFQAIVQRIFDRKIK